MSWDWCRGCCTWQRDSFGPAPVEGWPGKVRRLEAENKQLRERIEDLFLLLVARRDQDVTRGEE